jgi:uncharacterized protein (TIGR00369 family)
MSTGNVAAAERDYGLAPPATLAEMSGSAFLSAIRDGRLPAAPITRPLGFELSEVEPGRALFRGKASFAQYNPIGLVHGGWTAKLLDSCMACAAQSTLSKGSAYTTLEFKINLVRTITEDTGPVEAEGKVVQADRRRRAVADRQRRPAARPPHHDLPDLSVVKRHQPSRAQLRGKPRP